MVAGKISPDRNKILPVKMKTAGRLKAIITNPLEIGPKTLPMKVVLFAIPKTFPRSWGGVERPIIVLAIGMIAP